MKSLTILTVTSVFLYTNANSYATPPTITSPSYKIEINNAYSHNGLFAVDVTSDAISKTKVTVYTSYLTNERIISQNFIANIKPNTTTRITTSIKISDLDLIESDYPIVLNVHIRCKDIFGRHATHLTAQYIVDHRNLGILPLNQQKNLPFHGARNEKTIKYVKENPSGTFRNTSLPEGYLPGGPERQIR